MSLLNSIRAWRHRRRLRKFRKWMRDNQVVWDGARRYDYRDFQAYFRRSNT